MAAKSKEPDTEAEEGAAAASTGKLSLARLVLAGAAIAVLVACGGAGAYYFFFLTGKKEEKVAAAAAPKPATFFDLPDVLVNLSSAAGDRAQYLKVKIVLEVADAAVVAQIQPVLPRVMDAFQSFLRELRPADLEGSAGTYRLREELTRRVNAAIAPSRVTAVLFKEMVIQ